MLAGEAPALQHILIAFGCVAEISFRRVLSVGYPDRLALFRREFIVFGEADPP